MGHAVLIRDHLHALEPMFCRARAQYARRSPLRCVVQDVGVSIPLSYAQLAPTAWRGSRVLHSLDAQPYRRTRRFTFSGVFAGWAGISRSSSPGARSSAVGHVVLGRGGEPPTPFSAPCALARRKRVRGWPRRADGRHAYSAAEVAPPQRPSWNPAGFGSWTGGMGFSRPASCFCNQQQPCAIAEPKPAPGF